MDKHNQRCFSELIAAMSLVMDMEENIKLYHGWRVALLADRIGALLRVDTKKLFYGGLLHDIGAMGLDDHIVHQALKPESIKIPVVLQHPIKGAAIISNLPGMGDVPQYILDHHETWDGTGYPMGKKGPEISLGGHVIFTADIIDLLLRNPDLSDRDSFYKNMLKMRHLFSPQVFQAAGELLFSNGYFAKIMDYNNLKHMVDQRLASSVITCPDTAQEEVFMGVFADIIDAKHVYTGGHSRRVAGIARSIARQMDFKGPFLEDIYKAALLHDFGKVAVPRRILDAPRKLTGKEFEIIKEHPERTSHLLETVSSLKHLAWAAGSHHERYDGRGYPRALKKDAIPVQARIISVADTLDAVTSNRPYQERRNFLEAAGVLIGNRGLQLDPDAAGAALELLDSDPTGGSLFIEDV